MLRRILVAQLLTVLLDSQGADPNRLMEAFPEEFASNRRGSDCSKEPAFPSRMASSAWSWASDDLTDALLFLVDRHLVSIQPDGRAVPADAHTQGDDAEQRFSLFERDEGFGARPLYEWDGANALREHNDPFDFDQPRRES